MADRPYPAFAVRQQDSRDKSAAYTILLHPEGGRKDILRWIGATDKVAARMGGEAELETAGVLDSKFGAAALVRQAGRAEASFCLAFFQAHR
jgi:hypothetical protein